MCISTCYYPNSDGKRIVPLNLKDLQYPCVKKKGISCLMDKERKKIFLKITLPPQKAKEV